MFKIYRAIGDKKYDGYFLAHYIEEEDFNILKKWHKIAAKVGSIDEFMDKVRVH